MVNKHALETVSLYLSRYAKRNNLNDAVFAQSFNQIRGQFTPLLNLAKQCREKAAAEAASGGVCGYVQSALKGVFSFFWKTPSYEDRYTQQREILRQTIEHTCRKF